MEIEIAKSASTRATEILVIVGLTTVIVNSGLVAANLSKLLELRLAKATVVVQTHFQSLSDQCPCEHFLSGGVVLPPPGGDFVNDAPKLFESTNPKITVDFTVHQGQTTLVNEFAKLRTLNNLSGPEPVLNYDELDINAGSLEQKLWPAFGNYNDIYKGLFFSCGDYIGREFDDYWNLCCPLFPSPMHRIGYWRLNVRALAKRK